MKVAGYEEFPLTDGAPFMADPLFWPTYLSALIAPTDDELVTAAFGVAAADCYAYYDRLTDPETWPVLRLGLRDEHEIDIVFYNEPGEYGVDFLLCRSGGENPVELATLGGHELRPGLSWPELITAAGTTEPNTRLLLLMPAFGDLDLPPDAAATVTAALESVGAGAGAADLAAYMLRKPPWWPHWRRTTDGALVSDGRYSRRNPDGPAALPAPDLLTISTALA
ncbi:hypothetical protein BJ973_004098 [Actinoplanes tereljensis]|uniref:hypothetical protein n=1 Tax=Paractinoplanes tereljensis TaxID=571912 RepID=UPI0019447B55|nr:hypothetical protein [Actinoplanes tereljensis]